LIAAQAAVTRAAGSREAILDALVAGVMKAVPQAEGGVIELRDGDELVHRSGHGSLAPHDGLRLPLSGSLSGHCLTSGKPVLCPDVLRDPRAKRDLIEPLGVRAAIYVPVSRGDANVGVLKLQSSQPMRSREATCAPRPCSPPPFRPAWPRRGRPRPVAACVPARRPSGP